MAKNQNLQDAYLNQLRKERINLTVFLVNGVRLKGVIKGFDSFVILLKDANQQLIYKHAISTIIPEKDVILQTADPAKSKDANQLPGSLYGTGSS